MEKITAGELAKVLGVGEKAIRRKALRQGWRYIEEPNPRGGKPIKFYIMDNLPADIKEIINGTPTEQRNINGTSQRNTNGTPQTVENKGIESTNGTLTEHNGTHNGTSTEHNGTLKTVENQGVEGVGLHFSDRSVNQKGQKKAKCKPKNAEKCKPVNNGTNNKNVTKITEKCKPVKKSSSIILKDDFEIWLSVSDVISLTGKSKMAISKNRRSGKYISKPINKQGGTSYLIALSSLSPEEQAKWVRENIEKVKKLPAKTINTLCIEAQFELIKAKADKLVFTEYLSELESNPRAKERFAYIYNVLKKAVRIPFEYKKKEWFEKVAKDFDISRSTVEKYIKIYKEEGFGGLVRISIRSREASLRAWDERVLELLKGMYLKNKKESGFILKKSIIAAVQKIAIDEGLKFGSVSGAYAYLDMLIRQDEEFYATGGRKKVEDRAFMPREFRDMEPFFIIVGDQHVFDRWVRDDETGEIFRPMGFFWADFRTRLVYGYSLSGKKYNKWTVVTALRTGVMGWSIPTQLYVDNGKPEGSLLVKHIAPEISLWGGEVRDSKELIRKARPYAAQSKPIEAFFKTFERKLDGMGVFGKVKNPRADNATELEEKKRLEKHKHKLFTYTEFADILNEAVTEYNNSIHSKLGHTPLDELRESISKEGFTLTSLNEYDANFFFTERAIRKVDRGRVRLNNILFEGVDYELFDIPDGTPIEIRFRNMSRILCLKIK